MTVFDHFGLFFFYRFNRLKFFFWPFWTLLTVVDHLGLFFTIFVGFWLYGSLLTIVDRCWPVLTVFSSSVFKCFAPFCLFLTLLTIFGRISHVYKRAECWPYAAFINALCTYHIFWGLPERHLGSSKKPNKVCIQNQQINNDDIFYQIHIIVLPSQLVSQTKTSDQMFSICGQ